MTTSIQTAFDCYLEYPENDTPVARSIIEALPLCESPTPVQLYMVANAGHPSNIDPEEFDLTITQMLEFGLLQCDDELANFRVIEK